MSKTGKRIFLSYHVADREPVHKIADYLSESGFPVWDPEQEILPGADWTSPLMRALDSALAMIVFVSPEAIESRWVSREIEYALGAKHLRGRLIPVILRPAKRAPWILQSLQPVRYESPAKTGRQILEILSQPVDVSQAKRSA
jgi:TIR domain